MQPSPGGNSFTGLDKEGGILSKAFSHFQAGADLEQRDGKGNRPLDRAIALGSVEVSTAFTFLGQKLNIDDSGTLGSMSEFCDEFFERFRIVLTNCHFLKVVSVY